MDVTHDMTATLRAQMAGHPPLVASWDGSQVAPTLTRNNAGGGTENA